MATLKRYEYGDPADVADRHQRESIGCNACAWPRKQKGKLVCSAGQPGFPDATNKTCSWWRIRRIPAIRSDKGKK